MSSCLPGTVLARISRACNSLAKISLIRLDLPEPDTPLTTTIMPSGIVTSMPRKLFSRAPLIMMDLSLPLRRFFGTGISFFPETGFYWGSMYISYVITVLFSAVNVVVIGLLSGWNIYALLIGNAILLGLGFPLFFRFSRVLWLQLNMPFSKEEFEKFADKHGG